MNPNRPLNGCEINVRFCFVQYKNSYVLKTKFIGCIRNVRIGSFFNVYLYNALFEFVFVTLNQNLDFSFCELLFTIKGDVNFPFYKF